MKTSINSCYVALKFVLLLLVLSGSVLTSSAQNNKKAKKLYDQAQDALSENDYVKAVTLYSKVVSLELEEENPDNAFLGDLLYTIASWYAFPDYYKLSYSTYFYSAVQQYKADSIHDVISSLYQGSLIHDSIKLHDTYIRQEFDSTLNEDFSFSVRSILSTVGDTTWFYLDAGKNQGIQSGKIGYILTRYADGSDRGNKQFGRCGVKETFNTYSLCWAVRSESAKGLQLIPGDNVELSVAFPANAIQGIFYDLAKLNVYFLDRYKKRIYSFDQIQLISKEETEEAYLSAMRLMIQRTASELYDPKDKSDQYLNPLDGGIFKGQNMWEAMLNCTNDDVRMFLRFVASFPAKYMGRDYRIDETFATWVINNTPLSAEHPDKYTNAFLKIQDHDSLETWLETNKRIIWADGFDLGKVNSYLFKLMADSAFDRVHHIGSLMVGLTKELAADSMQQEFMNLLGQNHSARGDYEAAVDQFKQVLKVNPDNANAHWFMGSAYLQDENYKYALREFKIIMDSFPYWAGGHGLYGWTLLKQGNFPEAYTHCHKAYTLDSFNTTYIMNYAHASLMMNKKNQARRLYVECLENMDYASTFTEGIIEDFDFFRSRMWKVDEINAEQTHLYDLWKRQYQYKVMANESFEKGKEYDDEEKHLAAAQEFEKAIEYELKGETIRYDWLRSYYRWAAYKYYHNKDYEKSVQRYRDGWDVSRTYLNNLEYEVSDLENVGNIYSWLDDDVHKDMYRKMQYAVQRKLLNQKRSNKLFVISVGVNSYGNSGYKYAEADAEKLAEVIRSKSELVFDETSVVVFNSANTSLENIKTAFDKVIGQAREGDCFVFYYSGYCSKDQNGLMVIGKDTLKNNYLISWMQQMRADKKLILMDAANASFIKEYSAEKELSGELFNNENLTFLLSDGRIELPEEKSGLFTSHLISGLSGKAYTDWDVAATRSERSGISHITAKGLEGFMYGRMNRENMQFELKSYSYGADFPIVQASHRYVSKDTIPPMIFITGAQGGAGTRGGKSKKLDSDESLYGQALDASGIETILVNNKNISFTQNGKFRLAPDEIRNWKKLVIKAKDRNGLWAEDSVFLHVKNGNVAPMEMTDVNSGKGTKYALLVGTNEYDHWADLKNPINDVREIGEILSQQYGYKVEIAENKTYAELDDLLDSYIRKKYGPNDQLFVFFAGHGIHDPFKGGMIICKDSDGEGEPGAFRSYLEINDIKSGLKNAYSCKNIMLTLDVCYGGAAFEENYAQIYGEESLKDIRRNPEKWVSTNRNKSVRLFLTSGDSTYVSDGAGDHSPFAEKFIATLLNPNAQKANSLTLIDFVNNMRYVEEGKQSVKYGTFGETDQNADFIFVNSGNKLIKKSSNVSAGGFGGG